MPINRILTDTDRSDKELKMIVDSMYRLFPMSGHKIADAMVQEAFVFQQASYLLEPGARVLAAGSFHDVAAEFLRYMGVAVYDVDPVVNYDLHTFRNVESPMIWNRFDGIVSTSVLEHTADPKEFIIDCCELLKPNGVCVMTMDFKDDWNEGDPVPYTSNRFFTVNSLNKLRAIIQEHNCDLVDEPDWTDKDRFVWDGINYSFATFVFRKAKSNE